MEWVKDIRDAAFVLGVVAQAAITWWRVDALSRKAERFEDQLRDLETGKAAASQLDIEHGRRLDMLERRVFNGGGH